MNTSPSLWETPKSGATGLWYTGCYMNEEDACLQVHKVIKCNDILIFLNEIIISTFYLTSNSQDSINGVTAAGDSSSTETVDDAKSFTVKNLTVLISVLWH